MAPAKLPNGVQIYSSFHLVTGTFNVPDGVITNAMIAAAAGISASKLEHDHRALYSQKNVTATDEAGVLYVVKGSTCTVQNIEVGSIVACEGNAEVTIDVKKNGTTVLSSTMVLDDDNVAYTPEAGTVSVTAGVNGEVYTYHITTDDGGASVGDALATGVYVSMSVDEDYA
jgi:hypothetical protein